MDLEEDADMDLRLDEVIRQEWNIFRAKPGFDNSYSSRRMTERLALMEERMVFPSKRFCFDEKVGLVA